MCFSIRYILQNAKERYQNVIIILLLIQLIHGHDAAILLRLAIIYATKGLLYIIVQLSITDNDSKTHLNRFILLQSTKPCVVDLALCYIQNQKSPKKGAFCFCCSALG